MVRMYNKYVEHGGFVKALVEEFLTESWTAESFFTGGGAYALRDYGVIWWYRDRMAHFQPPGGVS